MLFLLLSLFTLNTDITQTKEPPAAEIKFENKDITGIFRIKGEGTDENNYSGIVTISQPAGSKTYTIRQLVGNDLSNGIGMLLDNADGKNNRLAISWKSNDTIGITIVDFKGKSATVRWTALQSGGQILRETWSFLGNLDE